MEEPTNIHAVTDCFIETLTENQLALRAFIGSSVGEHADAQDVLQKTNIILWKKSSQWDESTPFLRWAFAVARYEVLAHFRGLSREKLIFNEDVILLMADEAETTASNVSEQAEALKHCLSRLNAKHRHLLNSKYLLNRTIQQMSEELKTTEDSVKSLLYRLRSKLSACVKNKMKSV